MIEKIFVVHHTHTDIGYTDVQQDVFEDHVKFLDDVLDYCRKTDDYPDKSKFRWTCETCWTVKNYLEKRPGKIREFIERVKEGRIEITAFYLNITELYTAEELIRSLYFGRELERKYGIKAVSAMSSDMPAIPWIIPQILIKSGIKYLSMAVNVQKSFRPNVPDFFYWASPDGSRVLTWNQKDRISYGLGYMLGFGDSYETISKRLPDYLERLEEKGYPYDACCIRMALDNVRPHIELSRFAKEWNERHESPQIIVSTNKDFFRYIQKRHKDRFPSYMLAWPDWWSDGLGTAASETGLSRNTHRELITAEKFSSFLSLLNEDYPEKKIKGIWENIFFFDEHTWGSFDSISNPYSFQTKAQWGKKSSFLYNAALQTKRLLEKSNRMSWPPEFPGNPLSGYPDQSLFAKLSGKIKNPSEKIVVFNPLVYKRSGIVSRDKTVFLAEGIPPLGYKTFEPAPGKFSKSSFSFTKESLENKFYKITLDLTTGGVKSIRDKELNRELIDGKSPYRFNQYIYEEIVSREGRRSIKDGDYDERENICEPKFRRTSPGSCRIKKGEDGSFTGSLITETKAKGCSKITQEIILYQDLKRIDIVNTLNKEEVISPEGIYYAFPFNFNKPDIRFEISGAAMRPDEQLPHTAKDYYSIQDWIAISDKDYSLIWVTKEAPLVQFADINTGKWIINKLKIKNGNFFSWVMNNYWYVNWRAGQGGEVSFRYSLTSLKGRVSNSRCNVFAQECNNPLIVLPLARNLRGILPEKECSFLSMDKENVSLLALKRSEDKKTIVARLQEIEGKDTLLKLKSYFTPLKASLATLAEREIKRLPIHNGNIVIPLKKFEIVTVRINFNH